MSDVSQGPGWWQATDGKWYPPELHPDYQKPPLASMPPPVVTPPTLLASAKTPVASPLADVPVRSQQAELPRSIQSQVQVMRRVRPRRLPCGHCSQRLPRFVALAPGVMTCPHCSRHTQVMESALFRRGYAVN